AFTERRVKVTEMTITGHGDALYESSRRALVDNVEQRRIAAVEIVRRTRAESPGGDRRAIDSLLARMDRSFGALVLAEVGDAAAVEPLIESLRFGGADPVDVANALGDLGDERGVPALVEALADLQTELRGAASAA